MKQLQTGQYIANCPCCSDTKQHLYIKSNDVGVALDCKRGCSAQEIVSTVGLKMSDLFTSQQCFLPKIGYIPRQATPKIPTAPKKQKTVTAPSELESGKSAESPIVTWRKYKYTAKTGEKLQKNIAVRENGDKFAVWKREINGEYAKDLNGLTPTLYHAENLAKGDLIFIVEGEKDVKTMEKLGFLAVCSPHGSKWNADYAPLFTDKIVVAITDNDEPGRKYGKDIAESLGGIARQGVCISAKSLMPSLKEKGDISDIVEQKGADFTIQAISERVAKRFPPMVNISEITDTSDKGEAREKNYIEREGIILIIKNKYLYPTLNSAT